MEDKETFEFGKWLGSGGDVVTLFRRCTKLEAQNTVINKCAGGVITVPPGLKPSEKECVEQVGNNEGMGGSYSEYEKKAMEKMKALGLTLAPPKPKSPVVEYSIKPADLFSSSEALIKVKVQTKYLSQGSGSSLEGYGVVVYRGIPLESAEIVKLV